MELGQIFFSGGDFDLSCPNQVWDKKYLNRRTGDNPAKTSSQKAKIPPNRKRYFLALFSQAAIPSKIEQGQIFFHHPKFLHRTSKNSRRIENISIGSPVMGSRRRAVGCRKLKFYTAQNGKLRFSHAFLAGRHSARV